MGITTWKEIEEHNESSKLFFGAINGFSPAFRIVSSSFGVGFCRLMSTAGLSTCTFLLIFIVVSVTVRVRGTNIAITLKLTSRSIEKSLLTWWFIGTVAPTMIVEDVSCVIGFIQICN